MTVPETPTAVNLRMVDAASAPKDSSSAMATSVFKLVIFAQHTISEELAQLATQVILNRVVLASRLILTALLMVTVEHSLMVFAVNALEVSSCEMAGALKLTHSAAHLIKAVVLAQAAIPVMS